MKGGKATPGKAGKGAAPPPDPPSETPTQNGPLSPQEVARKQRLLHMWKEHKAAIQHEGIKVLYMLLSNPPSLSYIHIILHGKYSLLDLASETRLPRPHCLKHSYYELSSINE